MMDKAEFFNSNKSLKTSIDTDYLSYLAIQTEL
jgi:hypothetical protein